MRQTLNGEIGPLTVDAMWTRMLQLVSATCLPPAADMLWCSAAARRGLGRYNTHSGTIKHADSAARVGCDSTGRTAG